MVDDSYESNGYDRGDDENGDPEVPILPDGIAQSVGDNSSKEKTHRAGEFVGRTFTSEKGIWLWRKIIANGGFWTATATVAIAVTSFYQWQAIKRQWEEMKKQSTISSDTEHRQLRAYLLPDNATVTFSSDGRSYSIYVQIKNFGQTPAYTVNRWMNAEATERVHNPFEYFVENKIKVGKVRSENVDLGNGQSLCIAIKNIPFNSQSPSQEKAIYVRGIVKYWDSFQRCQFDAFILQDAEPLGKGTQKLIHVVNWATDTPSAEKYENCTLGLPPPPLDPKYFDESPIGETDSVMYVGECTK